MKCPKCGSIHVYINPRVSHAYIRGNKYTCKNCWHEWGNIYD